MQAQLRLQKRRHQKQVNKTKQNTIKQNKTTTKSINEKHGLVRNRHQQKLINGRESTKGRNVCKGSNCSTSEQEGPELLFLHGQAGRVVGHVVFQSFLLERAYVPEPGSVHHASFIQD